MMATISAAIDAQLATISFDPARIAFLNVVFQPVAGRPYLRASMPSLTRKALTMGADRLTGIGGAGATVQWDGVYEVDAVWPTNAGSDGCSQMEDTIMRLFPRGLTLNTTDGIFVHFDTPTPLPPRPDGDWYRGCVRCPWWALEEI